MAKGSSQVNSNLPVYGGNLSIVPGTPLMDNTNIDTPPEVFSPFFEQDYGPGVDVLGVPNVGTAYDPAWGMNVAKWPLILTDLLQYIPNSPGMGLVDERYDPRNPGRNDPDEALWVRSIRQHAMPAVRQNRIWTMLPGDVHINPDLWNPEGLTKYRVLRDRLHPDEQRFVDQDPILRRKAGSGEFMTVGEYFRLFGEVVTDKEDVTFIPHCHEGLVQNTQSAQELLKWAAQEALREQQVKGLSRPTPHVLRDFKTGLGMKSPADAWGLGGNNFYQLMTAAYRGFYLNGSNYRGQKVVVVGGTAAEYSLRALIAELVDLDFFVVLALPWSGTMGVDSLLSVVYEVSAKYAKKVFPTWDWLPSVHFGAEPSGFRQMAQIMRAQAHVDEFGTKGSPIYEALSRVADEHRRMAGRGETPPYASDRLAHAFAEQRFDGRSLYWTMPEIVQHLRKGG